MLQNNLRGYIQREDSLRRQEKRKWWSLRAGQDVEDRREIDRERERQSEGKRKDWFKFQRARRARMAKRTDGDGASRLGERAWNYARCDTFIFKDAVVDVWGARVRILQERRRRANQVVSKIMEWLRRPLDWYIAVVFSSDRKQNIEHLQLNEEDDSCRYLEVLKKFDLLCWYVVF